METERAKQEKRFWDRYALRYDRFMKHFAPAYTEMLDHITEDLEPEFVVLEVATGTGVIALDISSRVKKVFATDISAPMIEVAREKAEKLGIKNVELSVQDGYSLEFEDSTFDCAIIVNALHVMQEPGRAVSEIIRVLKPNGILICSTFCHGENVRSRVASMMGEIVGLKAYTRFSVDSFRLFIERSGLDIVDSCVIRGMPPLAHVVARPRKG